MLAALACAPLAGCWYDLADVVTPDEGCTGAAPRRCGTQCLAEGTVCAPMDVAGTYVVQLVNESNTCAPDDGDWVEGETLTVNVTFEQEGERAVARLDDLGVALFFTIVFGADAATFTGTVTGDVLDLAFVGANARSELFCTWTVRVELDAVVQGEDLLVGTLTYLRPSNGHPSCTVIGVEGCSTVQRFNATRPPIE